MNILAFKVSAVGDTVLFLPVIQEIRRQVPGVRITVVTTPQCACLYEGCETATVGIEELRRSWRRPWELARWALRAREIRADAVLLSFDQSSVARFLAAVSGAPVRIGGADSPVRLKAGLTREVAPAGSTTIANWDWEIGRALADSIGIPWPKAPTAPILAKACRGGRARQRVVLHPGASRDYQKWGTDRFKELARRLSRDFEICWVDPSAPADCPEGATRAPTPTLKEFVAIVAEADLFVGNHSGPFHIAAALGLPCVVPVGPTHPSYDPPWSGDRVALLRRQGLSCMPCEGFRDSPHRCTNASEPMACLLHWSVDSVEARCRTALARKGDGA